jgi:hypothetical protein
MMTEIANFHSRPATGLARVFRSLHILAVGSGVALYGIGSADLEMRECTYRIVQENSAMVENFLS